MGAIFTMFSLKTDDIIRFHKRNYGDLIFCSVIFTLPRLRLDQIIREKNELWSTKTDGVHVRIRILLSSSAGPLYLTGRFMRSRRAVSSILGVERAMVPREGDLRPQLLVVSSVVICTPVQARVVLVCVCVCVNE